MAVYLSKMAATTVGPNPPHTMFVGGGILFSRCPSVRLSFRRPSVTFWFFFNILKGNDGNS